MNKTEIIKISGAISNISGRAMKLFTFALLGAAGVNLFAAGIMDIIKMKKIY